MEYVDTVLPRATYFDTNMVNSESDLTVKEYYLSMALAMVILLAGMAMAPVVSLSLIHIQIVTDESKAKKDSEGVSQPLDNGAVFASNMVICGGYSGTGYPADKSTKDYDKIINMNRINLIVREGVTATDGGRCV